MKPRSQNEHNQYNKNHYPGTRQICVVCKSPIERCEEDDLYVCKNMEEIGPLCRNCYDEISDILTNGCNGNYYHCICFECNWSGSSKDVHGGLPIADTDDYSELLCPKCGSDDLGEMII